MKTGFLHKKRTSLRLATIAYLCTWLVGGGAWGGLQPPLGKITNPVFGTTGGAVPATVPPALAPYIKSVPAAIQLGKALFWDMQAGSDGVTACASCHYRAGADPASGVAPVAHARRDKNQLHPGPDTLFGNTATVVKTSNATDPLTGLPIPFSLSATGLPQFKPNYSLLAADFPLFNVLPATARLVLVDPVTGFVPTDPLTAITNDPVTSIRDTNDVVGSQGIRLAQFTGIDPNANTAVDLSTPLTDSLFTLGGGVNVRQVTNRNSPSVVNAVFNYTNFWDGRANNIFNGATPFGPLDQNASIWVDNGAALVPQSVALPNASLASQAVGPPLSVVEMSFKDRTFPELGRKMLNRAPLAGQFVHPQDSVLGALSRDPAGNKTGNRGININSYRTMVQAAFLDNLTGNRQVSLPVIRNGVSIPENFDQIEANFALFWGLAIQLYEATLVSDKTPFDLFQQGNQNAMSFAAQQGLGTFDSKCAICHSGAEFSSAVVGSNLPACAPPDCNPPVFTDNANHTLIRQTVQNAGIVPVPGIVTFDEGFFNIGVRPTADDPGRGGITEFDNPSTGLPFPLSFTGLAKLKAAGSLPFLTPQLPPTAPATQADTVLGAFKTPGLRNIELTAPYFHNGSSLTLDQVVEFYTRGGNFPNNPELAAAMQPIGNLRGDAARRAELVAFLNSLTDQRVKQEKAPFDHPELLIPNGVDANGDEVMITLEPTGGALPVVIPAVTINQPVTPVIEAFQAISGTIGEAVKATATVAISVTNTDSNVNLPPAAATISCIPDALGTTCTQTSNWSFTATGLGLGNNTITATATDMTGGVATDTKIIQVLPKAILSDRPQVVTRLANTAFTVGGAGVDSYQYRLDNGPWITSGVANQPLTINERIALGGISDGTHTISVLGKNTPLNLVQPEALATQFTWTVKANPPILTLNQIPSPAKGSIQRIGGTVELGLTPVVRADTSITIGAVSNISGVWSCQLSGLKNGVTNITVTATDIALNASVETASLNVIVPDGNIKGTGAVDISDALKALRIAIGLDTQTDSDLLRGDVAPLVDGAPVPDNRIDVADALIILRKVVGLISF